MTRKARSVFKRILIALSLVLGIVWGIILMDALTINRVTKIAEYERKCDSLEIQVQAIEMLIERQMKLSKKLHKIKHYD